MIKIIWFSLISLFCFLGIQLENEPSENFNSESSVNDILISFGDQVPKHILEYTPGQVRQGEELVKTGRTIGPNGKRTTYISKHYVCTTCHNVVQEDPDLRVSDPEARLPYVKSKGIPFLQGSTFKGIVNRESWYNDDYVKKYGEEKIKIAHNDLREAIQLCAIECSQGRSMKDWEIDAVLAYYWSLEFTLEDLQMSTGDVEKLNKEQGKKTDELVQWIKAFYLQKSPAHFYDAPESKEIGYPGLLGNPDNGKDIYELSCLYCHKDEGVSHYELDNNRLSFIDIKRTIKKNSHFSLYQIIPYGTYAIPGHRPYMPHYPLERMNKQQVEDLRAYVEMKAN